MPYLAILALLLIAALPSGGPQAATPAHGLATHHMQLAADDEIGRGDRRDLDDDEDDNVAPGYGDDDDDNLYDGDRGDSAHGQPPDDDDDGDDEDDGVNA